MSAWAEPGSGFHPDGQGVELCPDRPRLAGPTGDPARLIPFAHELGAIINASASGDEAAVVERLNLLMASHPLRPRISGHDASTWHLHVNDLDGAVSDVLIGEALLGLVLLVTELGATRFGRCAAEGCDRGFLDTTTNRSRRFCSTRCATRTNVAQYRRRQRLGPPTVSRSAV